MCYEFPFYSITFTVFLSLTLRSCHDMHNTFCSSPHNQRSKRFVLCNSNSVIPMAIQQNNLHYSNVGIIWASIAKLQSLINPNDAAKRSCKTINFFFFLVMGQSSEMCWQILVSKLINFGLYQQNCVSIKLRQKLFKDGKILIYSK